MKTKKTALIFLLIIFAVFRGFAEDGGEDGNSGDTAPLPANSPQDPSGYADARLSDLEESISDLKSQISSLNNEMNNEIGRLRDEFLELNRKMETRQGAQSSLPGASTGGRPAEPGIGGGLNRPVLIIALALILAALLACLALYIRAGRGTGKGRAVSGRNPPVSSRKDYQDTNSYRQSGPSASYGASASYGSSRPGDPAASPLSRTPGYAGASSGLYAQRQAAPAAPKPADEISPLYHSREKRENRHNSGPGDIFLDVSKSVLERLVQGEKVQLVFEKSGTRLSAQFVLVDNRHLYPNFHIYNETKELARNSEKVLSIIYNGLEGKDLPGYIESCSPAAVSARTGGFVISARGSLKIS
jgi:hypothetical protein